MFISIFILLQHGLSFAFLGNTVLKIIDSEKNLITYSTILLYCTILYFSFCESYQFRRYSTIQCKHDDWEWWSVTSWTKQFREISYFTKIKWYCIDIIVIKYYFLNVLYTYFCVFDNYIYRNIHQCNWIFKWTNYSYCW